MYDRKEESRAGKSGTDKSAACILAYGDSNTYGWDPRDFFGTPYDHPWPSILADCTGRRVINCGEPGREIPASDLQIQWLEKDLFQNAPVDWLILMLGTNDLLNSRCPNVGETARRMDHLLEKLRKDRILGKIRVLLIAPPPITAEAGARRNASAALAEEYQILADKYGITYADAAVLNLPLAYDGIHLTEEGHRMLAELLAGQLAQQKVKNRNIDKLRD